LLWGEKRRRKASTQPPKKKKTSTNRQGRKTRRPPMKKGKEKEDLRMLFYRSASEMLPFRKKAALGGKGLGPHGKLGGPLGMGLVRNLNVAGVPHKRLQEKNP